MLTRFLILVVALASACETTNLVLPDGGSCSCPTAASAVTYEQADGGLQSTNVQGALDELAAGVRGAETPVGPRLVVMKTTTPNNSQASFSVQANCPDPAHSIPLGGACTAGPYATLQGSRIFSSDGSSGPATAGYGCTFTQPTDNTYEGEVQVTCLLNAR